MFYVSEEFAAPSSERLNLAQAAVTLASICTKSISLKMEAACYSERSDEICRCTWCKGPQDHLHDDDDDDDDGDDDKNNNANR